MWFAIHMCMEAMLRISVQLSLSQTSKNAVFLTIAYVYSSTKSENKRAEQVLPGSKGVGGTGESGR
jgi:hypothetical protein